MKRISVYSLFVTSLLVLSSCLGDSVSSFTMSNAAGVVGFGNEGIKLIHVKGGQAISSEEFQSVSITNGGCILFDYSIDYSSGDNVNGGESKGYLTANIYENTIVEVPQSTLNRQLTDTSTVIKDEMALSAMQERFAYIEGHLFLYTEISNHSPMQIDSFSLSYNPQQQLGEDNVYNLYLRIIQKKKAEENKNKMVVPCAFNIKDFVNEVGKKGPVNFRVNYVTGFDKDSTSCFWKATEIFKIDQIQEDKK